MENPCLHPFGQSEDIDRTHDRGLDCLDGVVLVVPRSSRTGKVEDPVDLHLEGVDHVVANEFEIVPTEQVLDVFFLVIGRYDD